jgi:hypothetical protein
LSKTDDSEQETYKADDEEKDVDLEEALSPEELAEI